MVAEPRLAIIGDILVASYPQTYFAAFFAPFFLAAQYFRIRSDAAFRAAADMPLRFRATFAAFFFHDPGGRPGPRRPGGRPRRRAPPNAAIAASTLSRSSINIWRMSGIATQD